MIDIHNHYLPGVDDGADTLEDALALVRLAEQQGIHKVVCTPHYHHGRFDWDESQVATAFSALQEAVHHEGLSVSLARAAEVRFSDEILIDLKQAKIPFIGKWQGRDALLLELPHSQVPVGVEVFLKWLMKEGIQPIIAHPERNKGIMRDSRRAQDLVGTGAIFQLTAGSLAGHFGAQAQGIAEQLLQGDAVQFIASDAHNVKRAPAMRDAADAIEQLITDPQQAQAMQQRLLFDNPEALTAALFDGALHA